MPTYRGNAVLQRGDRREQVDVVIGWGRTLTLTCGAGTTPECVQTVTDTGALVQQSSVAAFDPSVTDGGGQPPTDPQSTIHQVWVDRGDGSYVYVTSSWLPDEDGVPPMVPPLGLDELTRIALDPALTVYP
jgi:hypothetical protein